MTLARRSLLVLFVAAGFAFPTACENPRMLRAHGADAYRVHDYDAARGYFNRALDADPADWKSHWYLGRIALVDGKPHVARTHLEQAFALRPEGPPRQPETPDIVDDLAEAIYQQDQPIALINFCDGAIRDYGTVHDYLRKARYLDRLGDADAAVVAYRVATRIAGPATAEPYVAFADFYESVGDEDAALIQLRHAYAIDPHRRGLADRIRSYGIVPGPTIALPPPGSSP